MSDASPGMTKIADNLSRAPDAVHTIAFTLGKGLSTGRSNASCTQDGCQVIVALAVKGGGDGLGVWVSYFLKGDVK